MNVWVVDAEECGFSVADSLEAAVELIKKGESDRGAIAHWESPVQHSEDMWTLQGHIDATPGVCMKYDPQFAISRVPVFCLADTQLSHQE